VDIAFPFVESDADVAVSGRAPDDLGEELRVAAEVEGAEHLMPGRGVRARRGVVVGRASVAAGDRRVDAEVLAERSPLIERTAPRVLARDFAARFPLKLSSKDVQLALSTARNLGVPLSGLEAVAQLQAAALAKGLGDLDQTATIQVLEEIAGVQVRTRRESSA